MNPKASFQPAVGQVPAIRRLDLAADVEDGAERIFLAAGLDPLAPQRATGVRV